MMQPIPDLLNRIRWDREFSRGKFEVGYYDRVEKRMIRVPFQALRFAEDDHFAFELIDDCGDVQSIPLHRIHQVYKNGELIWNRPLQQG